MIIALVCLVVGGILILGWQQGWFSGEDDGGSNAPGPGPSGPSGPSAPSFSFEPRMVTRPVLDEDGNPKMVDGVVETEDVMMRPSKDADGNPIPILDEEDVHKKDDAGNLLYKMELVVEEEEGPAANNDPPEETYVPWPLESKTMTSSCRSV
jgi:hypothetical protein